MEIYLFTYMSIDFQQILSYNLGYYVRKKIWILLYKCKPTAIYITIPVPCNVIIDQVPEYIFSLFADEKHYEESFDTSYLKVYLICGWLRR